MWCGWFIAHLIPLVWTLGWDTSTGDIRYYFSGVRGTAAGAMDEYPEVGTWPARLIGLIPGGEDAFILWFLALCVVTSGLFTAWLIRAGRATGYRAAWFWILFVGVSGPIVLTRLDLFPALAVAGFAALQFSRSPLARRTAPVLLAVATMMKLWPGVLGAALVGGARRQSTWMRVAWFFGALAVSAAVVAVVAGPDRLLSPLDYQSDRGLQVESLFATPLMVAAALVPAGDTRWSIAFAASKSFEIDGPGAAVMTAVATAATVVMVLFALGWAVTRLIRDDWSAEQSLAFSLTLVAFLIASNKVFSPQYVTWLAPLVAVALLVSRRRIVLVLAVEILVTAVLTTVIFPSYYDWLLMVPTSLPVVMVLALRNLCIPVILGTALWWASTSGAPRARRNPRTPGH